MQHRVIIHGIRDIGDYNTLRSIDQLDKVTAVTFGAGGNQLTVRDPNNVGADMVYDSLGRNTQRTDTFGDVTKTDYDRAGNAVKQTDAKNKFTFISFDSRNRRKSTTDRISAPTTFTYLTTGQLASLTDAESQNTAYTYDARGSKLTEQYPDHSSGSTVGQPGYGIVTFVYDKAGRVLRKQDQAGDTCSFNYDLAGRMTSRDYRAAANSPSGTIADSDTFTFDRSGRMLTAVSGRYNNTVGYAFDPVGRKASESLTIASQTYTIGNEFNARNELVKYTYPDSSVANRAYNARGGLSELKLDGSVIDTRTYDDGGRMTSEVLGNGITETRAYRTDNLLSSISFSNTNIGNLGYSWDANKNKTAETIGGVMSGYGFTSVGTAYDDEDRLTGYQRAATSGSALLAQSWALTSVGDWSSVTTNGTAVTRTHGPTHELLTSGGQSVTTDVKGNQTLLPSSLTSQASSLSLTWDYDNKLKSADIDNNASADVTFEYDALGRRVARTEGSSAVVYFQADQQTIADYPRGGAASTATYRYVFASYIDEPVVRKTTGSSGTVFYFHRNQQYSILALTDSSGNVSERYAYTAYGQPTFLNASATVQSSSAANNRYTFTAREWDVTLGLYHFRARWMSGLTGRFLTRDPIGFDGSRWNLFSYCEAGPLRRVDPSGLDWTVNDFFNHWWWGHGKAVNLDTDAGLLGKYRSLHAGKIGPILDSTLAFAKSLINCNDGPGAYSRSGNLAQINANWSSWSVGPADPLFVLGNSSISYVPSYTAIWLCEYCCASGGAVKVTSWTVDASVDFKLRDSFTNPYFVWEHDNQEQVRKQAECIQKAHLDFIRGKISELIYRERVKQCKKDFPTKDRPFGPVSGGDPYEIFANWTETKSLSGSDPCR